MRTTVTLDPDTAALVQRRMRERGVSFKQALNDAVRDGACGRELTDWLAQPTSVLREPTAQHLPVLRSLLMTAGTGGNLTSDADLAALAIEHRGTVVTYDADGRFPRVRWSAPSAT